MLRRPRGGYLLVYIEEGIVGDEAQFRQLMLSRNPCEDKQRFKEGAGVLQAVVSLNWWTFVNFILLLQKRSASFISFLDVFQHQGFDSLKKKKK